MAVGDVVNGVIGSSNNYGYFQPSGSTECIITAVFVGDYNGRVAIGTSGTKAYTKVDGGDTYGTGANLGVKIAINNSQYLGIQSNIASGYTGIVIA